MKLYNGLRTGMKFVTAKQYSATNEAHYSINTEAVSMLMKHFSPLTSKEKVLDFGCGTGETTFAIAKGELSNLGKPKSIVGVDVSQDMIEYCQSNYKAKNLYWRQLDVDSEDCQQFCMENNGKMDLITSFSCLHWVPNQPMAVSMFNKVLNIGGKFCFVIASTQNKEKNIMRKEFENMKSEDKWDKILKKTEWPHFKTVHRNNAWMSTVNNTGNGYIVESDYVRLMKDNGFQVVYSRSQTLPYVFNNDFIRNYFKSTILTSFNELKKEERDEFINEFVARLKSKKQTNTEGHYASNVDGFVIMGLKKRNI